MRQGAERRAASEMETLPVSEQAQSIKGIIEQLGEIVTRTKAENSPLGYFAALYRKVTLQVKSDIDNRRFEDNARMERLDVMFANRYLAAYDAHRAGQTPTRAWAFSFAVARQWWPIVLQHLLLGMNAHINLDLGVAAARAAPGDQLSAFKGDFDRINTVLAGLVGEVQKELAQIWPLLRLLNASSGGAEKILINFSMEKARDAAWAWPGSWRRSTGRAGTKNRPARRPGDRFRPPDPPSRLGRLLDDPSRPPRRAGHRSQPHRHSGVSAGEEAVDDSGTCCRAQSNGRAARACGTARPPPRVGDVRVRLDAGLELAVAHVNGRTTNWPDGRSPGAPGAGCALAAGHPQRDRQMRLSRADAAVRGFVEAAAKAAVVKPAPATIGGRRIGPGTAADAAAVGCGPQPLEQRADDLGLHVTRGARRSRPHSCALHHLTRLRFLPALRL